MYAMLEREAKEAGLLLFPILGGPYPLPSGPGSMSHALSPSYD